MDDRREDEGIERRVEATVDASAATPPLDDATTLVGAPAEAETVEVSLPTASDVRIGGYRIIRELGRGGQGAVFLAEDGRLRRKVALKVLSRVGQISGAALDRFRREAEMVSRLAHRNICTLYEMGQDDGAPFLAMQYVEGESIAARILRARKRRDDEARTEIVTDGDAVSGSRSRTATKAEIAGCLEMVEKIALALHHAHEQGIVHRDVKPANVLLTADGDEPIVLDFGLAHDEESAGQSLTVTGEQLGTPAYMAPEQIRGKKDAIDRRADVWGLGALLYEALTLERPFQAATRERLYQAILSEDPVDPRRYVESLPEDLVAVIGCALEKPLDRRYQTALDLAQELRRLRLNEPVRARPAGPLRRSLRWVQRHPAPATTVFVGLAAILGGLVLTLIQNRRLEKEARRADRNAAMAEASASEARSNAELARAASKRADEKRIEAESARDRADKALEDAGSARLEAERVSRFFEDALRSVTRDADGKEPLVREFLDQTAAALGDQLEAWPMVEARVRSTMAQSYLALGRLEEGEDQIDEAIEIVRDERGEDDVSFMRALIARGALRLAQGRPAEARRDFERAIAIIGTDPDPDLRADRVLARNDLGRTLDRLGEHREAEGVLRSALDEAREIHGEESRDTLRTQHNLGLALYAQDRFAEAMTTFAEVHEVRERVLGADHEDTISSLNTLSVIRYRLGSVDEAIQGFQKVVEARSRRFGADHPDLITPLHNLGTVLCDAGRPGDAEPVFARELAIAEARLPRDHAAFRQVQGGMIRCAYARGDFGRAAELCAARHEECLRRLGTQAPETLEALADLGWMNRNEGKLDLAEERIRSALEGQRRVLGAEASATLVTENNLGLLLVDRRQFDAAAEIFTRLHALHAAREGEEADATLDALAHVALVRRHQQRLEESESIYRRLLGIRSARAGEKHPATLLAMANLAAVLQARGQFAEAAEIGGKVVALRREGLGPDHPDLLIALHNLADARLRLGRADEALAAADEAVEGHRRKGGGNDRLLAVYLEGRARVLAALDRRAEAEKDYREAHARRTKTGPDPSLNDLEREILDYFEKGGEGAKAEEWKRSLAPLRD